MNSETPRPPPAYVYEPEKLTYNGIVKSALHLFLNNVTFYSSLLMSDVLEHNRGLNAISTAAYAVVARKLLGGKDK